MKKVNALSTEQIVKHLRAAIAGGVSITLAFDQARTFNEVYCGHVALQIGDWRVIVFNDCDQLDYIDQIESPDGDWDYDSGVSDIDTDDPFELLTEAEFSSLDL